MSDFALRMESIHKQYRIGTRRHNTFRDLVAERAKSIFGINGAERAHARAESTIWALRDVTLEVGRGERVGIIGSNGAGKSTLLKILSRITEPTSGRAEIHGRVSSLLEVGTGFHPELTGRENVYLNGAILGMRKREIDRKFDEIVAFAEVEQFLDTPVKRYSSGMSVRLAFAVAAHLEPEILIVDEVLAVGDVAFQRKSLGKMGEVAESGRTILLVSHNMASIQSLCARAVLLSHGEVMYDGGVDTAVAEYLSSVGQLYQQSLDLRTDRKGGDLLRFVGVEFLNPDTLDPLTVLISGQPVLIRIRYQNRSARIIGDVGIVIGFSTAAGAHLFSCRNKAVGVAHDVSPGVGYADCLLPRWMLKKGRYHYYLNAESRGSGLDYIADAGEVDVETGDYYGSGVIPTPHLPGVLVDYIWRAGVEAANAQVSDDGVGRG